MSVADRTKTLAAGDAAIAETTLPLPPGEVRAFLDDVGRLLRLNPLLAIERWVPAEWGFRFAGRNESNDRAFDFGVQVERGADDILLRYDAGLKQATRLRVETVAEGTRLVVTEHYPKIDDPQDPRVAEVDRSLVPWVAAIRRQLLARRHWGWLPGWTWWSERFMLAMLPRQRRIVRLLLWVSLFEFVVFLGLVVVLRYAA